ncbi:MAG: polysaccharide biosynthesis C-terminal domain-containing protein [Bacteroidia bacterium]|nr:polysaccharide biosynthesis C-terminal domain-containing protein [Bacteroidia bacterium]MDW8333861.1 polysaccharide biosynthesis C-terminal domain-containing protein [Bacteroidia bacterium]
MGLIRSQASAALAANYLGAAVGALNFIVLFPRFFSTEQIGLVRLLLSLSLVYTQVSQFGMVNALYKFYPAYRDDPPRLRAFIGRLYVWFAFGFAATTALYLWAKPWLVALYREKSPLYAEYYPHLIPLCAALTIFNVFEGFAAMKMRTVASALVKELGLRLATTAAIGAYAAAWFDFETFVEVYVGLYAGAAAIQGFLARRAGLEKPARLSALPKSEWREIVRYGAYAMFSTGAVLTMSNTDAIMLGAMVGLSATGVYGVYLAVATVVAIPARAVVRIAFPVVTRAFAQNDLAQIAVVYRKSVEVQSVAALWVFALVWVNADHLTALLKAPEYAREFPVFLWLGASFVVNAGFGINHYILAAAPHYRYELYLNVATLGLNIALNYAMIKIWGASGAAAASAVSMSILNLTKWEVLRRFYGLQPFSRASLKPYAAFAPALAAALFAPALPWRVLDALWRAALFSLIFGALCLATRAAPDFNAWLRETLRPKTQKQRP